MIGSIDGGTSGMSSVETFAGGYNLGSFAILGH
jgi:hypothetical protein